MVNIILSSDIFVRGANDRGMEQIMHESKDICVFLLEKKQDAKDCSYSRNQIVAKTNSEG